MSEKPVILIATGLFPPDIGGPATYSKILAEELPARGFEVKILSFGEVRKYPKIIRHFIYFLKIIKRGWSADIIYAQDPVSVGLPVMFASFCLGRSYWLKVVGDYAWEQGSQRAGVMEMLDIFSAKKTDDSFLVRILKSTQTLVAKRAKKIIVPSQYLKKIISNWGINSEKVKVIYNAFEGKNLELNRDQSRLGLGLDLGDKILISVGRLVPWKGFLTLIAIMPKILVKYPSTKLLIVGDGPEENNLADQIKENNLEKSIIMLGRLEQLKLFKYLRTADLFILNTAYEGFSHQLLEVMNLGTPIATTRIGGNPELINDSKNGLLFGYDNQEEIFLAIDKIFTDQTLADNLVSSAKETAKGFTRAKMVDSLVTEFKKCE